MYEQEIFRLGIGVGYTLCIFIGVTVFFALLLRRNNRYEKYLIETKQAQKYEEWKQNNIKRWKYG